MESAILLIVIVLGAAFGLLQMSTDAADQAQPIYNIRQITPDMVDERIRTADKISVTILRRSGYEYDDCSREFSNVSSALNFAAGRFAKAGLDRFRIVENSRKRFRIAAAYDSPGARRTGEIHGRLCD
uniref:hypothetical protein n=1 Tax=Parerythrobacter lutipelagi TaxID=1964208 RepID=UPI0010F9DA95|nr:hypothetical protein [Parerythrobacter lutipelagi]